MALADYVARLISLRCHFEALQSNRFLHGEEMAEGIRDIAWFDERGEELSAEAWQNPEARALAVQRAGINEKGEIDIVLMFVNAGHEPIGFRFPPPQRKWHLLLDSAVEEVEVREVADAEMEVQGHGVMVFANRVPKALRPIL